VIVTLSGDRKTMKSESSNHFVVLLARSGGRLSAIPLAGVIECLRPLPVEAVPGAPPFLLGLSVIRGEPVPVVDLSTIIGTPDGTPPGRYVLLRLGARRVALAVGGVVGVRELNADALKNLPPLLQAADAEAVTAIGVRDHQLLMLLQPARLVPDELWQAPASDGGRA
jgi:purine-binding chemotaxis protein CheW